MPRYVSSQLRWSEQAQTYILSVDNQESQQTLSNDWLEQVTSFSFHSRWGMYYTVHKQKGQRGNSYWYAYRRLHGRIVKRYLGRTEDLTLARLEKIARLLESESVTGHLALHPHQETGLPQPAQDVVHTEDAPRPSPAGIYPLLLSKLTPPRLHPFLLDRSHLFALLDAGRAYHLTLLSAPAGFGKTTLVCQWLAARGASHDFPPVAWVSLESSDNDPLRFWRYLITACQAFQIDLQEVHSALMAMTPQPPFLPSELSSVLTLLLNALARCPAGGILVLEDYHAITEHSIHETISFFLDHLPATLHVIIISRSDPPFSLARLRARNMVHEIRTADLRFSQEETSIFLHQSLSFALADETIRRLHTQLEGWGAGLQLMKLALQRTPPSTGEEHTLALFSRHHAFFQEYFATEVLDPQPEPVQHFLLQTSILARLTGPLCDAVTGQQNSQDMLTLLERMHLFLEPLNTSALHPPPTAQQWYRYHALFAEAMRNEARRRLGEDHLHHLAARASHWYEAHGYLSEAIDAALDAQDYERAANLIERFIDEHTPPGTIHEPHTLHRWLEQLPETILEQHPILCLSEASTLLFQNTSWLPDTLSLRTIEKRLRSAEQRFLEGDNPSKLGELFAFRSLLALRQGDIQAAIRSAKQALKALPQTQQIWRGLSLCIVAEEWIQLGQFQQARTALLEAYAQCSAVENHYFQRVAMLKLAQVSFELGELRQAFSWYHQVLPLAKAEKHIYVLCHALSGLAAICYEYNDLERACHYAQEAITISQAHQLVAYEVHATLILARVHQAQGQVFVAHQLLAALLDKMPISLSPLSQKIQTAMARLSLSIGDQATIQRWATGRSSQQDFSQETEEELLVSRWLRTQGKLEEASRQLERLLVVAQQAGYTRRILEIQVEIALVGAARKRKAEALHVLREVLVQALASNMIRLFLDPGEQMAILLRSLLPQVHDQPIRTYIRTLLRAFPIQQHNGTQAQAALLIEPLSPQEMRVLRLLVQHRSNVDIANELVVSVNTVRTHVHHIYRKLGVHTRSAASEVARELDLIS